MSESVYSKSYHVTDSILARVTVVQYWRTKIREISLNTEALTSAFPTLVLPEFWLATTGQIWSAFTSYS